MNLQGGYLSIILLPVRVMNTCLSHLLLIKVVYTSMQDQTLSGGVENYGWKDVNEKIQILWENKDFVNMHCTSKGCGCKGARM